MWTRFALNRYFTCIDPGIVTTAKTLGSTIVDLVTHPVDLADANQDFIDRTGVESTGASGSNPF